MNQAQIVGFTLKVDPQAYEDNALRTHIEEAAHGRFRKQYGIEPAQTAWLYNEGGEWEDPDTGEVFEYGPQWMLLMEGIQ